MHSFFSKCSLSALSLALFLITTLSATPVRSDHTEAELVAATESLRPGETAWIALRLKMDPTWHTYWINPGEAGMSTTINWHDLPEGITPGPIHWPSPHRYLQSDIMNYVYEGEIFLMLPLKVSETLQPDQSITLRARAEWLECDPSMCVPGEAELTLTLPVSNSSPVPSPWHDALEQTRQNWPTPLPTAWKATAYQLSDGYLLSLEIHNPQVDRAFPSAYFYSATGQVTPSGLQSVQQVNQRWLLALERDTFYQGNSQRLQGILQSKLSWFEDKNQPNLSLDLPLDQSRASLTIAQFLNAGNPAEPTLSQDASLSLSSALLFAFLGGMILNLMPCVFPVLGLKIMSFVNQAGENRARIIIHGIIFTAGVLISFWLLAGLLIVLRTGGQELGWGFQLQEPVFVLSLSILLLLFGLNMSGLFEIGTSAIGVGHQLTGKGGYTGTFFSGVLATVVATPCAAPFLAPALGAALALPPAQSLATFTAIGVGLSSPYLLLSVFPSLIRVLPRPGVWMETLKQGMAFLLYGTVAYLIWILAAQVSADVFLRILFTLVLVAVAAWIYGRWAAPHKNTRTRWIARICAFLLLAVPFVQAWHSMQLEEQRKELIAQVADGTAQQDFLIWEPWTPEREAELRSQNRFVYIDFTARWCATCQVNKRAYQNPQVIRTMLDNNVALLIADWTNKDPAITRALASFNRSAVPFNLLYAPGSNKPIIMPELFTASTVLDKLQEAGATIEAP